MVQCRWRRPVRNVHQKAGKKVQGRCTEMAKLVWTVSLGLHYYGIRSGAAKKFDLPPFWRQFKPLGLVKQCQKPQREVLEFIGQCKTLLGALNKVQPSLFKMLELLWPLSIGSPGVEPTTRVSDIKVRVIARAAVLKS